MIFYENRAYYTTISSYPNFWIRANMGGDDKLLNSPQILKYVKARKVDKMDKAIKNGPLHKKMIEKGTKECLNVY